jgi:hypothetical protein
MDPYLACIKKQAEESVTLYDKTQLHYTYMEYILDHVADVNPYRKEIQDFQQLYLIYVKLHEESIYGQFLTLLQQLMDKMD